MLVVGPSAVAMERIAGRRWHQGRVDRRALWIGRRRRLDGGGVEAHVAHDESHVGPRTGRGEPVRGEAVGAGDARPDLAHPWVPPKLVLKLAQYALLHAEEHKDRRQHRRKCKHLAQRQGPVAAEIGERQAEKLRQH